MKTHISLLMLLPVAVGLCAAPAPKLENQALRLEVDPSSASARLLNKRTGEAWDLGAPRLMMRDKSAVPVRVSGAVTVRGGSLSYRTEQGVQFQFRLAANPPSVEYSFDQCPADVAEVLLLDKGLQLEPGPGSYYALPFRMGILLYPEGEKPYTRRMANYGGYTMAMLGVVKKGSALLATWEDPYTTILADYSAEPRKKLSLSLSLRQSARSVRFQPLGRGGYVEIAKAYRHVARQRGYLKTLPEKMKENPGVARFFGAADFKPFAFVRSVPNTRYNRTDQERLNISFTFEECADLAEHFAKDLGIDRALLVLNGWINGGYDNRHPDVLPAAPEIGGDQGLIECLRRVRALGSGWVFGLHDNYQDFYRNAPSWNEDYIMKNPDGSLHQGGEWAGGLAYLICSKKSVELASRPQNVPRVQELFKPDLYFSDTIFAAPLYECSDPKHPLTWVDDLKYKTQLCDYLRKQVGLFGSEEGREWGVAHTDYFEGLMSHKTRWQQQRPNDDIIVPLFEIVYGDAIPMYTHQSDRPRVDNPTYILDHVLYAEMPVYQFGNHRYWTEARQQRPTDESRAIFARGDRFNNVTDRFIKNTYEVLSPLGRVTALLPMTDHRFLTPDRKVESTRFGNDVNITVNYGEADYSTPRAVLPQYGFIVESPALVAFYARSYGELKYSDPALFVIRSMDGKPLASSGQVRIYHGFGDTRVEFRGKILDVPTEKVL
jgi:hypothetical protein